MDTGVGAAGTLGKDALAGDARKSKGKVGLNGGECGLDLPAVQMGAVVAEDGLPERHWLDGITAAAA